MNTPEQMIEVAKLVERLEIEADKYLVAGPPHVGALLTEAAETIDALAEAVDALGEIIEQRSVPLENLRSKR